jgi:hypothetical protein
VLDAPVADVAVAGIAGRRSADRADTAAAVDAAQREAPDRRLRPASPQVGADRPQAAEQRRQQVGADLGGRFPILALPPAAIGHQDRRQQAEAV